MPYDLSDLKKYSSIPPRGDKPFGVYLKEKFLEYTQNHLRNYQGVLMIDDQRLINDLCARIINIVNFGLKGIPYLAVEMFMKEFDMTFSTFNCPVGKSFYRMRVVEDKRSLDVGELFHIPFSKQGKVENQRYSATGLPCLYLGSGLYGCWEEMKRPTLQNCMFSRIESTREFSCLDLVVPDRVDNDEELRNLLVTMPLIIACSIKVGVKNEKDIFKPEYIMPQTILQVVSIIDERNRQLNKDGMMGIRYRSVCQSSEFGFPDNKFDNIVIPAKSNGQEYDSKLCEIFRITKPTCEEFEKIRYREVILQDEIRDSRTPDDMYQQSLFGELEGFINDVTAFPLQEVENKKIGAS